MAQEREKDNKKLTDGNLINFVQNTSDALVNTESNIGNIVLFNFPATNSAMGQKNDIHKNEKEQIITAKLPGGSSLFVENIENDTDITKLLDSTTVNTLVIYVTEKLTKNNQYKKIYMT
ncbi:hypothetical protein AGMMS49936_07590 [Endomicrobiia bacterium]|nr:hypothetical protein AGMMS49936_07590 [Endomicrobiia bacterium]